ncbi:polyisoprenoid-binding protein [Sulfurimicrobium lacus]|uniref:Polyisoprenoid-binding protein n=1 Tax=Sulfurimicrobium lacus TaxID=2715678 RepID=A0A6F8VDU0_9PROT|nr:YceI family protein [Sulfurimicrobium lacus]BCB27122.1 polyisoprenoid-binding protein [Sulfurimicrobium lacus]
MKRYLAAFAVMGALATPARAADSYTTDPDFTAPTFEVTHLGFTTQHGRFNKSSGKAMIDFAARKGSVDFTVYTESLDMGSGAWTKHLFDEGLFNVRKYPTMTFKSDKLIFDGNKVVAAEGQFTMIGVTRPLKVSVNGFQCGSHPANKKAMCAGDVTATIRRSDFGLTKYIPAVSDEVQISVPVEAYKN